MKKAFLTVIVLLFMVTFATYALAMEPFYKGQWGMAPAEIKALYGNAEPFDTSTNANGNIIYTYAGPALDNVAGETSYAFYADTNNAAEKLYIVWNSFRVENTDNKRYEELLAQVTKALQQQMKAIGGFKYFTEKTEGGAKDGYQRNHTYWLGKTECIVMQSYWYGESADREPETAIDIDFYALSHPDNMAYAEALKDLQWRDLR